MRWNKLLIFNKNGDGPKANGPECSFNIAVSQESPEWEREMLPEFHGVGDSREEKRIARRGEEKAR
jgi:hypothetical protein